MNFSNQSLSNKAVILFCVFGFAVIFLSIGQSIFGASPSNDDLLKQDYMNLSTANVQLEIENINYSMQIMPLQDKINAIISKKKINSDKWNVNRASMKKIEDKLTGEVPLSQGN